MNTYIVETPTGKHRIKADSHSVSILGTLKLFVHPNHPIAIFKHWSGFYILTPVIIPSAV